MSISHRQENTQPTPANWTASPPGELVGSGTGVSSIQVEGNNPGQSTVNAVSCVDSSQSDSETLTFVAVASVTCNGITSYTDADEPDEEETVYVPAGEEGDTVTITALGNPSGIWPDECPVWSGGATPSEEDPAVATFPIDTPSSTKDETVVTVTCGTSSKAIKIVVFKLDLVFNGLPEETEDPPNEEDPGGFIQVNDNDNAGGASAGEGNGTLDISDTTPLPFPDPDLKALTVTLLPSDLDTGTLSISVPATLKLWLDQNKNATPTEWNLAEVEAPTTLYVEGFSPGFGDLSMSYEGDVSCSDMVKMTAVRVAIEYPYDTDENGKIDDPDNEFAFNESSPSVLQIFCQASDSPGADPAKFHWTIDDIGTLEGSWNPHIDGDEHVGKELNASVAFTGMPEHNSDFGRKKITLTYEGLSISDEEFVEVFFDPTARNNPGPPGETPPGTVAMEDLIE